ncbi:hypothetical protein LTR85_000886 [Meristemomyces frigidus]|nr:hypothetical protein LTR85_000886 [Meristemomyces frigidus]
MPVPFGISVGDFISGVEFIQAVIQAVEETTGSRAQYRSVTACLQSSKEVLTQLDELNVPKEDKVAISKIVQRYEDTTFEFASKIGKYDKSLGGGVSRKWWRSLPKKIQWQRYSEKDVRWYEGQLHQHASSLQILLAKIQCASNSRAHGQTVATLASLRNHMDTQMAAQNILAVTALVCIRSLHELLKALLLFNVFILAGTQRLQRAATVLPQRVSLQAEVLFEDAHGYISRINIDFIRSWRAFNFVLYENFRRKPGWLRVQNGAFRLHERFGRRVLDTSRPFGSVFRPGRHIRMSMLFNWLEVPSSGCPACSTEELGTEAADVTCTGCGLWYRRLPECSSNPGRHTPRSSGPSGPRYHGPDQSLALADQEESADVELVKVSEEAGHPGDFALVSIATPPPAPSTLGCFDDQAELLEAKGETAETKPVGTWYEGHILQRIKPAAGERSSWLRFEKRELPFSSERLSAIVKDHRRKTHTGPSTYFAKLTSEQQGALNLLLHDLRLAEKDPRAEWVCVNVQSHCIRHSTRPMNVKQIQVIWKRQERRDSLPRSRGRPIAASTVELARIKPAITDLHQYSRIV